MERFAAVLVKQRQSRQTIPIRIEQLRNVTIYFELIAWLQRIVNATARNGEVKTEVAVRPLLGRIVKLRHCYIAVKPSLLVPELFTTDEIALAFSNAPC